METNTTKLLDTSNHQKTKNRKFRKLRKIIEKKNNIPYMRVYTTMVTTNIMKDKMKLKNATTAASG